MQEGFAMKSWARSVGLGLSLGLATALVGCAADGGGTDGVSQSADELKGGIPANGKEKSNKGKRAGMGAAGAIATTDDAGAVDEEPTKGNGKGQGKDKADKVKGQGKDKAGKGKPTTGAAGAAAEDEDDEDPAVDEV
jgi:hypothetical protein